MKGLPKVSISVPKPSFGGGRKLRWTALVAFVATTVAFALSAVVLAAGTSKKMGQGHFWLSLNMSNTGQDLIEISTASDGGATENILNLPIIGDILGDAFDDINGAIDQGVQDLQGQIASSLVEDLGIKDIYRFYLSGICEGTLTNPEDSDSDVDIESCYGYAEDRGLRNITKSIPSSFVVGPTNISIPLVAVLRESLVDTLDLANTASKFMFTLALIGAITTGLMIFASVGFVVARYPRVVVLAGAILSSLGSTVLLLLAGAGTCIVFSGTSIGGPILSSLGTEADEGITFVVLVWIAAGFAFVSAAYWVSVWFVEARRTAFRRRRRTPEQMGNWKGIMREVLNDVVGEKKDERKTEREHEAVDGMSV